MNVEERMDFGQAFGMEDTTYSRQPKPVTEGTGDGDGESLAIRPRSSYDEQIRLAPYPFANDSGANDRSRIKV